MVIHCSEVEANVLKDGMMIHVASDGQSVNISNESMSKKKWNVVGVQPNEVLSKKQVSAVFVLVIKGSQILTIVNRIRGIDIPGGHVDVEDESVLSALHRELYEEARAEISNPQLFAKIDSGKEKQMFFYLDTDASLDEFTATKEVTERGWKDISSFLEEYDQGNKKIMRQLIGLAQKRI